MRVNYIRPEVIIVKGPSKIPAHPYIDKVRDSIDFDHTTGEIIIISHKLGVEICRFEGSKAPAFVVTMAAKEIARRREEARREDQELLAIRFHLDILDHFDALTSEYENFSEYLFDNGNRWTSRLGNSFHVEES